MDELIKVILLGIIEGITEFLPISSTGHLLIASRLFRLEAVDDTVFSIFIQSGAVVAILVYYAHDLLTQARAARTDGQVRRFWGHILLAFVPAATVGFLLSDWIDNMLDNPVVIGVSLIVGGIIFLIVERLPQGEGIRTEQLKDVRLSQALIVGLAQITALIPGVSRSGATILGGLFSGMDRQVATQFSFYLAIPTLGVATIYSLVKNLNELTIEMLAALLMGAVVSGIVAWLSIAWLLRYISKHDFTAFGWYRIIAGVVILILVLVIGL